MLTIWIVSSTVYVIPYCIIDILNVLTFSGSDTSDSFLDTQVEDRYLWLYYALEAILCSKRCK